MWCMYDVLSRYSKTNDIIFPLFGLATGHSEMEDWPTKNMNSWAKGRFFLQKMICLSANQSLFFSNNCYMSANFLTNELVLSVHSDWPTVLFVVTPVWFSVDGNQVILQIYLGPASLCIISNILDTLDISVYSTYSRFSCVKRSGYQTYPSLPTIRYSH